MFAYDLIGFQTEAICGNFRRYLGASSAAHELGDGRMRGRRARVPRRRLPDRHRRRRFRELARGAAEAADDRRGCARACTAAS